MGLFDKFKHSLAKTRAAIISTFVSPLWNAEEMERALIVADFGPKLATEIVDGVRKRLELKPRATTEEALEAAKQEIQSLLQSTIQPTTSNQQPATSNQQPATSNQQPATSNRQPITTNHQPPTAPHVLLMVGVNGSGKTTSVAKLAKYFQSQGGKVLLAAADTFRAAAIEQLKTWGQRLHIEVVAGNYGADPASVAHDAIKRAQSDKFTHLIVDTAGRQHTKSNLMQELQKVKRVLTKAMPTAPHETWLVVDAPTGSNALVQAREFHSAIGLTGVIVTKLDGSAKGGIVVSICKESHLPIRFVGLGEGSEDLEVFDAKEFAAALLTS